MAATHYEIPAAEHARTVAHMNKDHAGDLSLYLRHFNGVSARDAADAELVSLGPDGMVIRAGPSRAEHRVACRPPLTSWARRREVLVAMSHAARDGLARRMPDPDLSRAADTIVRWPALFPDLAVAGAVAATFAAGAARFLGYAGPSASAPAPAAAVFRAVRLAAGPVLAAHVVEVVIMARKLARMRVPLLSRPGLFWIISVFFEGFAALSRFDRMVHEKKREALVKDSAKSH